MVKKKNIAVLASGNGTNFQALVEAISKQKINAKIKILITDKKNSFVRKRANNLNIKDTFVDPNKFKSELAFDKKIIEILKKEKIDLIILAGYMKLITPFFVKNFNNKILNIHPSLLPAFKGVGAIRRAYEYGCKITGVTIHFIDEEIDHGPIILQETIKIEKGMSEKKLEEKVHNLEHKLYPKALKLILDKKIKVRGRQVEIIS
ncbi:MAG: phosphoribosylglycinamide formyltransferase [Candidatus Susulua stagnicola]|nr:phosphoribosylglycinamide formyltransferase [Candidatus Susulua stagnicola]